MTHTMPDTNLIVIALLLLALNLFLVFMFCRGCYCDLCPNNWALWLRDNRQLCKSCTTRFDKQMRRVRRRRTVLQRIFRTAA